MGWVRADKCKVTDHHAAGIMYRDGHYHEHRLQITGPCCEGHATDKLDFLDKCDRREYVSNRD